MTKRKDILILLLVVTIGGSPIRSSPHPFLPIGKDESSLALAVRSSVQIEFVEMRFGKPPLVELYFDIRLRNQEKEPRWFLLPRNMGPGQSSFGRQGGVDVLEVFAPKGKGRVVIGEFLGTGGFQALLLRAGGELRLRRLRISYWGDLPESIRIDILVATRLLVGSEPASDWFGLDPTSSSRADISERAPDVARHVRTKRTHDRKEVPVQIEEDRRVEVMVAIRKTKL